MPRTEAFGPGIPLTTRGDLLYRDANGLQRLAAGTSGQYLQTKGSSADPVFAAAGTAVLTLAGGAATGWSPAAATTYYFAGNLTVNPGTVDGNTEQVAVPTTMTLRAATFTATVFGTKATAGQNVTVSLRLNHTSDISIGAGDWSAQANYLTASGLSQAFTNTDVFSIKLVTPNPWTTLPTTVFVQAALYFDRP